VNPPRRLTLDRFAVSPCSNPELGLDEALAGYAELGFRKFEVFTSWAGSAFDYRADSEHYLARARQYGMEYVSLHLPPVGDDRDETLEASIAAARFAAALGVDVVLFKATSRENYIASAGAFLDATADLGVTPVLQNHAGTPIATLADYREVIDGIAAPRMRSLLEVGQFHSVGVPWPDGAELLGDSVALVHIKDQVGPTPVPFGHGQIDLPGLFGYLESTGYAGDIVVEMEAAPGDTAGTLRLLGEARAYLERTLEELHA